MDDPTKARMLSVFVATAISAKQVAQRLGVAIGMVPCLEHADQGARWRWRLLGIELILFDLHGLVNDCGIEFESFQIQIDLLDSTDPSTQRQVNALIPAMAELLAATAANVFQCKTMVVENLQRQSAVFGDRFQE